MAAFVGLGNYFQVEILNFLFKKYLEKIKNLLERQLILVTGGSEGVGRGVALQLALAGGGSKIYITGRHRDKLDRVVEEINRRGGEGVAVVCDHNHDDQTKAVFAKIESEDGKLDILVNNAYGGVKALLKDLGTPYWELGREGVRGFSG